MNFQDLVRRWAAVAGASAVLAAVPVVALGAGTATPAGALPAALTVTPTSLNFGEVTLGDFTVLPFTVTNTSPTTTDMITGYTASGTDPNDFAATPESNCPGYVSGNVSLPAGASCTIDALFGPGALGARSATLTLTDSAASGASVAVSGVGGIGYYQVERGRVASATPAMPTSSVTRRPLR